MDIQVLFFGQLTDITGEAGITVPHTRTIAMVQADLFQRFPALQAAKYVVAINNEIAAPEDEVPAHATIAFLPPFSGG